jgi:hypothetical protein
MHLTDQLEARPGEQPEAWDGDPPEAAAKVPPVEARVSNWLRTAQHAVGRIFQRQAAFDKSAAQSWRETLEQVITDLELLNRNTMQSELDVHDVHQGLTSGAPAEQPDCPSADAAELGENVEFF